MERRNLEKLYWETVHRKKSRQGVFEGYYEHLCQVFQSGIEEYRKEKGTGIPELSQELLTAFRGQMQRITLRTLLSEMELCEENGMLAGETEQDRYGYFEENFLGNPEYLQEVYEAYPTMYENMMRALENFIRNVDEMLERFTEDREEINRSFFPDEPCQEIRKIGGGSSDSHRNGHRVFVLELDNGEKLVYKPRSLAVDRAYAVFLGWIFEKTGMPFWWNRILDRKEYGWCQWVPARPCHSREEMERYYYRNGILLCVSYLLGSEDLHYENLIACGEYPVIVDLEMAVGSRSVSKNKKMTGTERFYLESVLRTGLLPLYTWNSEGEGVNVGAINGRGGQLVPVVMPVVVNPGTVKMHIEYRRPKMGEGNNLATLDGEFVEPYEFLEEIQRGFQDTYAFLAGNKERVLGKLKPFRSSQVRYLVRDTQQYSMLLMTMGHPDLLTADSDRHVIWDALENGMENGEAARWIRQQEGRELFCGDVPYFYYYAGEKRLYSGTGECFEDYFDCPVMEGVEQRLRRMCTVDMVRQQKLIRVALLMGTKRVGQIADADWRVQDRDENISGDVEGISDEKLEEHKIRAAEKLAGILLREAIWFENEEEVGWISIIMAGYRERGYMMRPMDDYLYGGLAGVAVFMAELAEKTGKAEYCNMRRVLINSLFRHTDSLFHEENADKLPTGAYSGEASVAFAYMLLYSINEDPVFLQYLWKQCQVTARWLTKDQEYDVLGGNAGAVMVFLKAYHLTGKAQYLEWAREAGDCLLRMATVYVFGMGWVNRAAGTALTGFAHGTAGIMLALARLGYEAQEKKYLEAAYQAYRYEEHYYMEELQDWEDLRDGEHTVREALGMAWCHGWGGIVMARMEAAEYVEGDFKKELEKKRDFAEKKMNGAGYKKKMLWKQDFCLCHGRYGNLALLAHIGNTAASVQTYKEMEKTECQLLNMMCKEDMDELLGLQECSNYGMMEELPGLGIAVYVAQRR